MDICVQNFGRHCQGLQIGFGQSQYKSNQQTAQYLMVVKWSPQVQIKCFRVGCYYFCESKFGYESVVDPQCQNAQKEAIFPFSLST